MMRNFDLKKSLPWAKILDVGWVLLVAVISTLLAYSNIRDSGPFDGPDTLAHQGNAYELIQKGIVPDHGQGLSYSGYGPPGTSFLFIPGVLLMSDPRAAEVPGAFLLHLGTLLFVLFLVREWFGRKPAWAAVALTGFVYFTGPTLWPNGHPFFVIGMLYCLMRWVRDRSAAWFSAAVLLAGLGMYVYFTIAPALAALLVIALLFRRPVSIRGLALTAAILVAIWFPYLRFESARGFSDLATMVFRRDQETDPAEISPPVYCYASLPGETDFTFDRTYMPWTGTTDPNRVIYPGKGLLAVFELRVCTLANKLDRNFDSGVFLFGDPAWPTAILFGMYAAGMALLVFRAAGAWPLWMRILERLRGVRIRIFLLAGAIGTAVLFLLIRTEVIGTILVGDPEWDLPTRLLLTQARAYGIVIWNAAVVGLLLASHWDLKPSDAGVPAVMIAVGGGSLWLLAEIERSWRFWWFWPLQAVAVAAALSALLEWWKPRRWIAAAAVALAIGLFFPWRQSASEVGRILAYGYGGRESGQLALIRWLSDRAQEDPARILQVGVARYNNASIPTLAWGTLAFGWKYVDPAPNIAAAGVRAGDEYRVLEFTGADQDNHPPGCPWDGYGLVWESRRFAVCRRRL
jgi:hypothetical protein